MNEKISFKERVGYGLGDAASSIFWKLFSMYLLFFYTDIFGISAAVVGTMFLVTRLWDALNDPIFGVISDRTVSRWGKFRPYILFTAIPFGILGTLTFVTPDFGYTGKVIYAYVTYTFMMMIYSCINVPYASLLGVMSPDPKQRTILSSYRMIFAFAGSILVLLLIEPFVDFFGKLGSDVEGVLNLQFGWGVSVAIFAVIAVIFFFCTFSWTRERVKPIKEEGNSIKEDLKDLADNKPWWILLGASISVLIFNSIRDGAAVYYFKYYVDNTSVESLNMGFLSSSFSLTTIFLVLGQIANILGILFVSPLSSKIGKKKTYLFSMFFASILSILFYFVGKGDIAMMLVLQFFISMCAGAIFPLLWSMYADIADYSELHTGRRATGLIFSSSSMSQKFGWTLGGALTGWLLAYFGFQANVEQSELAQTGIRMMLSLLPAIGAILAVVFISFYPLSEKKMEVVSEELKQLRAKGSND